MTITTGPQIFDCAQYSPDWWALRRGIATASEFGKILTPAKAERSKQQEDYIAQLIAEKMLVMDEYSPVDVWPEYQNAEMIEGLRREPEARSWYAMERNTDIQLVGFVLSACGRFGASPDALTADGGCLEMKNPLPKTHLRYLLRGTLPDDYKCQVHGQLIVTEREYVDFFSYCPGFPPLLVRATPDEFTDKLREELERFHERYQETLTRFEAMR